MIQYISIFISGSIIGSFLNVCIYRLPLKVSVVKPASYCPSCKNPIPYWSNIPILGFLILKGKCNNCNKPISVQYPIVEVLTGLITVLSFHYFGLSRYFIIYTVFIYFLIVIGFIDYKTQLIFNRVLIALATFGLVFQIVAPFIKWNDALLGVLAGGVSMFLISVLGMVLFKKESLGMGDVKFAAVAGFFIGWKYILIAIYAGFVFAFIAIILMNRVNGTKISGYIPLGPFLAGGIFVFLFWGEQIIQMYLLLVA